MSRRTPREASKPFSIRLTESERAQLTRQAGTKPLGLFVRERVLGEGASARPVRRSPLHDAEPLARALAVLGQSELSGSLSTLAREAQNGSLPVDEDVIRRLNEAYDVLLEMRFLLLQALGKSVAAEAVRPAEGGQLSSRFHAAVLADRR